MKKDGLTKYFEALYSEKSQLNAIQNLEERKIAAAKKAGMDPDAKEIKEIMSLENQTANKQMFEYLSRTQSNEFFALISDQELFWQIQSFRMTPSEAIDAKEKMKDYKLRSALSKEADELLDRIEFRLRKIFKHDGEIGVAGKLIRMLTPEQRIKKQA